MWHQLFINYKHLVYTNKTTELSSHSFFKNTSIDYLNLNKLIFRETISKTEFY